MYDLKIVGGTIVDGSGQDRYSGDVGIKDGRIVDVGKCGDSAAETMDADGAIVAPGFVDIHTHYDGQISWDEGSLPLRFTGSPPARWAAAELVSRRFGRQTTPSWSS